MTRQALAPRLFVFARHAESTANTAGVLNADPAHHMPLTERGRTQARQLGAQLDCLHIDLAVATRFLRTQQTAELALGGRDVPLMIEPHFDEVRAGVYDGTSVDTYWAWEEQHPTSERLPEGESVDEALLRIADGLRRLLSRAEPVTLVVLHSFAVHHIASAAGSSGLPGDALVPNAVPYLFHEDAVARAAVGLDAIGRGRQAAAAGRGLPSQPG